MTNLNDQLLSVYDNSQINGQVLSSSSTNMTLKFHEGLSNKELHQYAASGFAECKNCRSTNTEIVAESFHETVVRCSSCSSLSIGQSDDIESFIQAAGGDPNNFKIYPRERRIEDIKTAVEDLSIMNRLNEMANHLDSLLRVTENIYNYFMRREQERLCQQERLSESKADDWDKVREELKKSILGFSLK